MKLSSASCPHNPADTQPRIASYGSLARFTDVERLKQVGTHTVVGAGGDVSDMQFLYDRQLESLIIKEEYQDDGHHLRAKHIYSYLSRVMYHRRCKMDPFWNVLLVAGWDDGKPYVEMKSGTGDCADDV